jgi:hypothetical protein
MKSHALERIIAQCLLATHNSPNIEHVSASDLEGSGRSDAPLVSSTPRRQGGRRTRNQFGNIESCERQYGILRWLSVLPY